jgi:signal transduction histidine kinase
MDERPATDEARSQAELRAECRRLTDALALAERDRQLLGYEIHDGVVQDLTAAAMLLEGTGRQATFASPEVRENFDGGLRLLQDAIAEARQLIRGVTTTVELDDRGFIPAVSLLVEKFRTEHGLPVKLDGEVGEISLPLSAQHLLLRILQEALYNVAKHARASEVEVRLARSGDQLELTVADNGVGFEPTHVPAGHFGLESIRARARLLGADLLFDTAPQHGTRVIVRLNLPPVV